MRAEDADQGPTPALLAPATRKKYPNRFVRPLITTDDAVGWIARVCQTDPAVFKRYWMTYRVIGAAGFTAGGVHCSVIVLDALMPRTEVGAATGTDTGAAVTGPE
jgi:hypothetical protein